MFSRTLGALPDVQPPVPPLLNPNYLLRPVSRFVGDTMCYLGNTIGRGGGPVVPVACSRQTVAAGGGSVVPSVRHAYPALVSPGSFGCKQMGTMVVSMMKRRGLIPSAQTKKIGYGDIDVR